VESAAVPKKAKFNYKAWYKKNGAARNAKRRERYHDDPIYRSKVIAVSTAYKKQHPQSPKGSFKVVNGSEVPVLRIGAFAKILHRTVLTIRNWQRDGFLPMPTAGTTTHRVYLHSQLELTKKLATFMNEHRYQMKMPEIKKLLAVLVSEIADQWNGDCTKP
jgi:hypothetical protein